MGKDLFGKEIGEGLSQRKDGRYSARFRTKNGQRRQKYFDKLIEAKAWLRDEKYLDAHGMLLRQDNITVDAWFEYWLDIIKGDTIRYATSKIYRDHYRANIHPYIGNLLLQEVRPMHCQNVINEEQKRVLGESAAKHLIMIMNMMFQSAVENRLIASSPVLQHMAYIKDPKKEWRVLTVEEQNLFLEVAKGYKYYEAYAFVLQTGIRYGELAGLQWGDIDFDKKMVHIQRTFHHTSSSTYIINPPKTQEGDRFIPLTQRAIELLIAAKNMRADESSEFHDFVFLNRNRCPIKLDDCDATLRRIADRNQMERFTMHTLRHTFATRCMESDMKIKILQKILGHAHINITMDLYVHATDDEISREMEQFERWV